MRNTSAVAGGLFALWTAAGLLWITRPRRIQCDIACTVTPPMRAIGNAAYKRFAHDLSLLRVAGIEQKLIDAEDPVGTH